MYFILYPLRYGKEVYTILFTEDCNYSINTNRTASRIVVQSSLYEQYRIIGSLIPGCTHASFKQYGIILKKKYQGSYIWLFKEQYIILSFYKDARHRNSGHKPLTASLQIFPRRYSGPEGCANKLLFAVQLLVLQAESVQLIVRNKPAANLMLSEKGAGITDNEILLSKKFENIFKLTRTILDIEPKKSIPAIWIFGQL